ncbi:hypothetical protein HDU76_002995 [Blyttiomyces sp. JEL0837]|nr:hypothetical protein HDU76_002995 [Blyttiomyces sp. JEL0837]
MKKIVEAAAVWEQLNPKNSHLVLEGDLVEATNMINSPEVVHQSGSGLELLLEGDVDLEIDKDTGANIFAELELPAFDAVMIEFKSKPQLLVLGIASRRYDPTPHEIQTTLPSESKSSSTDKDRVELFFKQYGVSMDFDFAARAINSIDSLLPIICLEFANHVTFSPGHHLHPNNVGNMALRKEWQSGEHEEAEIFNTFTEKDWRNEITGMSQVLLRFSNRFSAPSAKSSVFDIATLKHVSDIGSLVKMSPVNPSISWTDLVYHVARAEAWENSLPGLGFSISTDHDINYTRNDAGEGYDPVEISGARMDTLFSLFGGNVDVSRE